MSAPDANGWMPIETVDEHAWLIWLSDGFSMSLGFWMPGEEYANHGSVGGGWRVEDGITKGGRDLYFLPTHWQPTPKPPVRP